MEKHLLVNEKDRINNIDICLDTALKYEQAYSQKISLRVKTSNLSEYCI